MTTIKLYLAILLFALPYCALAQDSRYEISKPINISANGANKVLCLKNGNTALLHFEKAKPVMVRIFDSAHKQIANREHMCRQLDINVLRTTLFMGLYDINGEIVLFADQEHLTRHRLVRVRFNGRDGRLIEEAILGSSEGISKKTRFHVMKNKQGDDYAILFSTDAPQFQDCDLKVKYYNARHETVREVPLAVDRKKYDYMDIVGAELLPAGVCISLGLSKMKVNGDPALNVLEANAADRQTYINKNTALSRILVGGAGSTTDAAAVYYHFLAMYVLPNDGSAAQVKTVDVSTEMFPYYGNYSYNPFAKTINLLVLSYRDALYRYGIELRPTALVNDMFFKMDEQDMTPGFNWIKNQKANEALKAKAAKSNYFEGLPVKTFTNENGLSTMVSQGYSRYNNIESYARSSVYETYFGDIGITQYNDDGNEIWGTVLPLAQYYKSYEQYYRPVDMAKRWQEQELLNDLPPQVHNRQFVSVNTYSRDKDLFIVYNDNKKNFDKTIGQRIDTVFDFELANACYYKINKQKEVTKHYVFGTPKLKESMASFIEGADFDEQRGVYASLVQYRRNESVSLRMAWSKLD